MAAATAVCSYRIALPADISEAYEKQSTEKSLSIEDILAQRLRESIHHTSAKPLYLSDTQRQALERVLGRNLHRPKDLVEAIERMAQIRVENVKVLLSPDVMDRLKSRHFSDEPFDVWLAAQVREWAERAVELR